MVTVVTLSLKLRDSHLLPSHIESVLQKTASVVFYTVTLAWLLVQLA